MYKKMQKEEFISLYMENRIIWDTALFVTFEHTEIFENKFGKDAACFNKDEILEMLKAKKSISVQSLANIVSWLRSYTKFIESTGKEVVTYNYYNDIKRADLEECRDKDRIANRIITREDLNNIENELLNETDKAILECLYNGIGGKQLVDLTSLEESSVDEKKMCINLSGNRKVPINLRTFKLLYNAFNETDFVSYSAVPSIGKVFGKGRLYKARHNTQIEDNVHKFRWVIRRVALMRNYVGIDALQVKTIALSGLVNEVKTYIEENNIDFKTFIKTDAAMVLAERWGLCNVSVLSEKIRWFVK